MRVDYKGIDADYDYRVAEISFNDAEADKVERIVFAMSVRGWDIDIVTDGYAVCEVDSYQEYREFMQDWKECRRVINNCTKYGF